MHPMLIQNILRGSALFSAFDDEDIVRLAERMHVNHRVLAKGDVVIHAGSGDDSHRMYIVLEGALKVGMPQESGERETVLNVLTRGAVFGELAMLDGGERSASVSALMPSQVASLHQSEFYALCERHPQMLQRMVRYLCGEVRRLSRRFDQVATMSFKQRLAAYLLELGQTFGHQPIRITQQDLSGAVGATREQVSRQMKAFYQDGYLVKLDGDPDVPEKGPKVSGRHAQLHITPAGEQALAAMLREEG